MIINFECIIISTIYSYKQPYIYSINAYDTHNINNILWQFNVANISIGTNYPPMLYNNYLFFMYVSDPIHYYRNNNIIIIIQCLIYLMYYYIIIHQNH